MDYFKSYEDDITESNVFESTTFSSHSQLSKESLKPTVLPFSISSAPHIETYDLEVTLSQKYINPATKVLYTNPKIDTFNTPVKGPLLPQDVIRGGFTHQMQNHLTGSVESYHINEFAFDSQYHNYYKFGIAADPSDDIYGSAGIYIGRVGEKGFAADKAEINKNKLAVAVGIEGGQKIREFKNQEKRNEENDDKDKNNKKRRKNNDSSSISYQGPWAPYLENEEEKNEKETKVQERKEEAEDKNKKKHIKEDKTNTNDNNEEINSNNASCSTSIFHGKSMVDYQGRSWVEKPKNFKERVDNQIDYIPKKHVHTFIGHTMGVQAIRFFPSSGHLLLSAGMDSKMKIWDVYNQRKCLRTYTAHSQAVKDIHFTVDGSRFYSCSYDRNIHLWDTEYGKVVSTFSNNKTPFCVAVHTDPSQQNIFIVGTSNKRAVQFDANTGDIVQEYNEHLAAVNTVTFCENNRKIVTSSDDKKIFIWEYGIPVVVKHIAEACMHSMPSITIHPSKMYLACQSMDNQILVYEAFGRFRFQPKKKFKKHICAGYAIHPNFSTDGRFLMTGDIYGKLWFYDWKTMKNYKTLECHDGVCIDCAWHPVHTSKVATCGWDGLIKLWD